MERYSQKEIELNALVTEGHGQSSHFYHAACSMDGRPKMNDVKVKICMLSLRIIAVDGQSFHIAGLKSLTVFHRNL